MTTQSIDVGITYARNADRVDEDHYFVNGFAVDLAIDACECGGGEGCHHVVAATIHQARHNRAAA